MDMMGMDMGGMDTPGLFTTDNEFRAKVLWYIIAAAIGCMMLARTHAWVQSWRRHTTKTSSRPSNVVDRVIATATAVYRELTYPQPVWFTGRFSKFFTPPSLGRCLLLACYWIVILTLLWSDVLLSPGDEMYPYRWEKVGFRAAWISVAQIPFIYLLSCKFNPISLLTGVSYERFNWLHRWSARTVFLTVIVHWSYFFFEWWQADFVQYELELMPMVKYGFGAWAVIGWMTVSGFGFFRAANYEFFVLQHIFAAATLLWLLYVHVPAYAAYNIWLSVGFVVFDWAVRIVLGLAQNIHIFSKFWTRLPGYSARLEPLTDGMTRVVIDDMDFTWRAGQHICMSMPSIRPLENHPFTIANAAIADDGQRRPLTMVIKSHSGFSKSLYRQALKDASSGRTRRIFLGWPLGMPPDVSHYDSVILLACSTGLSFVMPLLQELIKTNSCVRQIQLHWIIKSREHLSWYDEALIEVMDTAQRNGLHLSIKVHVTRFDPVLKRVDESTAKTMTAREQMVRTDSNSASSMSASSEKEKTPFISTHNVGMAVDTMTVSNTGRPSVEALIRPGVESAIGETAVVSCGGLAFTAQVRTFVAQLSDERAVHKGSGAQGIYLATETYGW